MNFGYFTDVVHVRIWSTGSYLLCYESRSEWSWHMVHHTCNSKQMYVPKAWTSNQMMVTNVHYISVLLQKHIGYVYY